MSDQPVSPNAQQQPNNFPHEGQHTTITRDGLNQLKTARAKPNYVLDYTIGGPTETHVHASVEADRSYALNTGHKRLNEMSDKLQTDHVFAASEGRAKAQFQAANDTKKSYAQLQRDAAQEAQTRSWVRNR